MAADRRCAHGTATNGVAGVRAVDDLRTTMIWIFVGQLNRSKLVRDGGEG